MSVSGHDRSGGVRDQRDWCFGPPSRRSFAFGLTQFQVSLGSGTAVFGFVLLVVFGWGAVWPLTCSAAVAGFLGFGVVADRRVDAWIFPLTGWVRIRGAGPPPVAGQHSPSPVASSPQWGSRRRSRGGRW